MRIAPSAERDLERLTDWLADVASEAVALRYISRIHDRLDKLSIGSERGTIRDDNTKLRIIGILPSVSVAFSVDTDTVNVQRILYRGQLPDE